MEIVVKRFDQLTLDELYEIIKIRVGVFVVEQNCAYQDLDDVDKNAYHVYIKEDDKIYQKAKKNEIEELFTKYYNDALLYTLSLTKNSKLAEEIVSTSFF